MRLTVVTRRHATATTVISQTLNTNPRRKPRSHAVCWQAVQSAEEVLLLKTLRAPIQLGSRRA